MTELKQKLENFSLRSMKIKINWAFLLFAAFFLTYGYFGGLCPDRLQLIAHPVRFSFVSVILLGFFAALTAMADIYRSDFSENISLHKNDLLVFLSYLIFLLVPAYEPLQFSLYNDELSAAGLSQIQTVKAALLLAQHFSVFEGFEFKIAAQLIALLILMSLVGLFAVTARWKWPWKFFYFSLLLISGRIFISVLGGNGSPHPPLELVPPFISSTVLGFSNIAFKMSYFFSGIVFLFIFYRLLCRVFKPQTAYLLGLAAGTIPLFLHLSTVIDHSFWGGVVITLVLTEIVTAKNINFARMICFVCLASLMRIPLFIGLVPLFFLYLVDGFREKFARPWWRKTGLLLIPILTFLPFLAASLISGTPSTKNMGQVSVLLRVWEALHSGFIFTAIANSLSYYWIAMILLIAVPARKIQPARRMAVFLLLMTSIFIYFSIDPSLWGMSKYQVEYAVPFAIIGLVIFGQWVSMKQMGERIFQLGLVVLVVLNLQDFLSLPSGNVPVDQAVVNGIFGVKDLHGGFKILAAYPYEFTDAYRFIKEHHMENNTYSVGATYGTLPEIINGYTLAQLRRADDIHRNQTRLSAAQALNFGDVSTLNADPRIQVVLLGVLPHDEKWNLLNDLLKSGWTVVAQFRNEKYGSTILVLKRPES